ncbi:MAG: ADP-ribosyltransferase [Saccharofermentans sp.]|nr:ADP-ribosyltransferase [Saccharofermentans sp.]
MGIIALNEDGIEELKQLSSAITGAADELSESSVNIISLLDNYADELGPHFDSISEAIEGIRAALDQAIDPIEGVSGKLNDLADKYEAVVSNDRFINKSGTSSASVSSLTGSSGGGSAGASSSALNKAGSSVTTPVGESASVDIASSVKSAGADWAATLSDVEKEAIKGYTNTDYVDINKKLRGLSDSWTPIHMERAKAIHFALGRSSIPCDCVVYRGASSDALGAFKGLSDDELKGKIIRDKGFMSTSLDRDVSSLNFSGGILFEIEVPKGSKGAYVGNVGQFGHLESEVLFDCNRVMEIKDVQTINGKRIIKVGMLK